MYTKTDMFHFANYIRNGISNLEYCSKTEEEHLHDWKDKNPKKSEPKLNVAETKLNEAHKLLAGLNIGMKEYNPISTILIEVKDIIRELA